MGWMEGTVAIMGQMVFHKGEGNGQGETATLSKGAMRGRTPPRLCYGVDPPNRAAGINVAAWPLPRQQQRAAGGGRVYGKMMARLTVARRKWCSKVDE
jgi:hypothetical protein